MKKELDKRGILSIVLCTILTLVLVANYFAYILGNKQEKIGAYQFDKFQEDSEYLVYAKIAVNKRNIDNKGYGLSNVERIEGQVRPSQWSLFNNPEVEIKPYLSQVGLQGYIFSFLYNNLSFSTEILYIINCTLMAIVVMAICILLGKKYNKLMSIVFYIVFLLSPWICAFARNLYWVEFTWFLPMLIGLYCAINLNNRRKRVLCYILTYVFILIKCLCGYEYISTIMLGSVQFLLADLAINLMANKPKQVKQTFLTIFFIGILSMAGFMTAICIHAVLKGDGDIAIGIKNIYEQDVLRRTFGGSMNDFGYGYLDSFNASIYETLRIYFHFDTEIITGLSGNLFPLLCIIPIFLFISEYKKEKNNIELIVIYSVCFITSVSWFVLAKAHSYIHTHMNYVLWYFGYIQVCIYVICQKIYTVISNKEC